MGGTYFLMIALFLLSVSVALGVLYVFEFIFRLTERIVEFFCKPKSIDYTP